MTMPKFEPVIQSHILYRTCDTDAPKAIKDRNGDVVLGLCKICGKAEVELDEPCVPLHHFDQLTEAYEAGKRDGTAELAAEQAKSVGVRDKLLTSLICQYSDPIKSEYEKVLAIQPDDSALKAWLGEPVARLIPVSLQDGYRVWARTFDEYSQESSKNNMYRNGPEIPLYSPKGLK